MIGDHTNRKPSYKVWDVRESNLIHSEIDMTSSCSGVIEEYKNRLSGLQAKAFYRCKECRKDVTTEVRKTKKKIITV